MKQHLKTLVLGGTLAVGSFGTVVALAQASGGSTNSQTQGQMQPNLNGSIKVPQDNQSEGAEAAAYSRMAKVTLGQAVKAAQSSLNVSTSPSSAQLGNENGSLVWEVVIGQQSVLIDAGNAKVLQAEPTNAPEMADNSEDYDQAEQGSDYGNKEQGDAQQEQGENDMEDGN